MKTISVGRDSSNEIVLDNKIISRHHAKFLIDKDGEVTIKDLGGPNGTYVNGNRITECVIVPGDKVQLGNVDFDWELNLKLINQPYDTSPAGHDRIGHHTPGQTAEKHVNKLNIDPSIADELPLIVKNELASMPQPRQLEFVLEYNRNKKSLALAYVFLIFVFWLHYGYMKKWGLQVLFWITAGGLGIWWLVDLFRLPGLVKNYNMDIAIHVMRNMQVASRPVQNKTMMGN